MNAKDIKVGRTYLIVQQYSDWKERATVIERLEKSSYSNAYEFRVKFPDAPEGLSENRKYASLSSRLFHHEWTKEDDEKNAEKTRLAQEREERRQEASALQTELTNAGYSAQVTPRGMSTYMITLDDDSFFRLVDLLLNRDKQEA